MAIDVAFRDFAEASSLAKELLYRSKKFVNELSNFMSQDFHFWKAKGYDKTSSWELTCCSVRRLYEDIHQVRIIARDVRDLEDAGSTAALVLWATIRSHKIMEDYSRRNFYEHPSISAVIARHLAANHTKPDSALETRVRKLEDTLGNYTRKFDSLESRIARIEAKNGIPPPQGGGGGARIGNTRDLPKWKNFGMPGGYFGAVCTYSTSGNYSRDLASMVGHMFPERWFPSGCIGSWSIGEDNAMAGG